MRVLPRWATIILVKARDQLGRRFEWGRYAVVVSAVVPLVAVVSSCADVIGLDSVDRVPCALDCDGASSGFDATAGSDAFLSFGDTGHQNGRDTGTRHIEGGGKTDSGSHPHKDASTTAPMGCDAGAINPDNACQSCEANKTMWGDLPDGTGCGMGFVCLSGTCTAGCYIDAFVGSGTVNSANVCEVCQPAASTSAWSPASDGTSCGSDEFCTAGTCSAMGCFIAGAFEASGAVNPADTCQSCQPGTSATAFSTLPDGTPCGTGTICNAGSCVAQCLIGGSFFTAGQGDPSNGCMACEPATSATSFSPANGGVACGGACGTCAGGSCANTALLAAGGACTVAGECCSNSCACSKAGCFCG
jgi:hypothetical protein